MAKDKILPKASIGADDLAPHGEVSRKSFLGWMIAGWTAFALATGGFLTMIVRFLFPMHYQLFVLI